MAVLHRKIAVDPFLRDTPETGLGKNISPDVGKRDAAVPCDGANSLRDVRGFDGAEGRLQRDARACIASRDFSIGGFSVQRAGDGIQLNIAEGIANGHGAARRRCALDPAIVRGAIHAAMYIGKRDAAETIGNVGRAANSRNLDVSIAVVDLKIANYISRFDTPKRSSYVCARRAR